MEWNVCMNARCYIVHSVEAETDIEMNAHTAHMHIHICRVYEQNVHIPCTVQHTTLEITYVMCTGAERSTEPNSLI